MQTLLSLLMIAAAAAYCLGRIRHALAGKSSGCGHCQRCPASQSGSPSGQRTMLVQLGSGRK